MKERKNLANLKNQSLASTVKSILFVGFVKNRNFHIFYQSIIAIRGNKTVLVEENEKNDGQSNSDSNAHNEKDDKVKNDSQVKNSL